MYNIRSTVEELRKRQEEFEKELAQLSALRKNRPRRDIFNDLRTPDRETIAPFRVVYVDQNGNDSTGDGSLYNPFASIAKGVEVANEISIFNVFVALGPTTYLIDNPLDLPNNTFLVGWSTDIWVASPINPNLPCFTINNVNADVNFRGGAVLGLFNNDTGIEQNGVGSTVIVDKFIMRNLTTGFRVTNGAMQLDSVEISELDQISIGYEVTNGAVMSVGLNQSIDNATATTLFNVDGMGSILNLSGPTIVDSVNIDTFLKVDNGAVAEVLSAIVDGPTTGVELDNGSAVSSVGSTFRDTTTDIRVLDTASVLNFVGAKLDKNKLDFVAGFQNANLLFQDNTEGEEATKIIGDLYVGRPELGTQTFLGRGEPVTRGMNVLTTDSTATAVADGGNITDVSVAASSFSGSTFTFQGTAANHTILMGLNLSDGSDVLTHAGVFVKQTTAAVEVTKRSFAFEYWDGAAWVEFSVMAIQDENSFRYANEVFIRANNNENIRYDHEIQTGWTKKTINGLNLFWARIRITAALTTAPVFEQFRLHPEFAEFSQNGIQRFYGRARYRATLLAAGNVYSETGGIANANLAIGVGVFPGGWTHRMNNSQMNGPGDAIYLQFVLPRGVDTSNPLFVVFYYIPEQAGASTDATVTISVLPIEVQGTVEADPAGGVLPVLRTLANTEAVTTNAGQGTVRSTPIVDNTKLQQIRTDAVDISDYYEGDEVFIRIELTATGSANKDLLITAVEVDAVNWTPGERLR